jgi:hypothetical protein
MEDEYKESVKKAMEAVKYIEDADLRKSGFEIILKQLLQTGVTSGSSEPAFVKTPESKVIFGGVHVNKTGLTEEELQTLFSVEGEVVKLKVKPIGESVAEQQQLLAHAILFGYYTLLGKDSILATIMGATAREWNLLDTNFSRTIQAPGHIQSKGKGRGVNYSFRPGAVTKLKDAMQKMACGE